MYFSLCETYCHFVSARQLKNFSWITILLSENHEESGAVDLNQKKKKNNKIEFKIEFNLFKEQEIV